MKLNLIKPLAVFDLETTGTNVATDRIIEISIIKINPDGKEQIFTQRINPGIPIPLKQLRFMVLRMKTWLVNQLLLKQVLK